MRRNCWRSAAAAVALLALGAGCSTLSVSDERRLGDQFDREARRQFRFVGDPVVNDYVSHIGNQIVRAIGPQPFEFRFHVIDDPEINAFAGPAGHIYVNTGTIERAANVSELAGVLAHEIGHVALRHVAQNYEKQQAASVGHEVLVLGAGMVAGTAGATAADLFGGLGTMAVLNTFGRDAERQADDFAVQVLPRAGYDPRGLPSFFETLVAQGGPKVPTFLSSHPAPAERLETTRAEIASATLPPDLRVEDGGRLEIIQERIQLLTGREPTGRRYN
jgi:predicted Zn-dependent protease